MYSFGPFFGDRCLQHDRQKFLPAVHAAGKGSQTCANTSDDLPKRMAGMHDGLEGEMRPFYKGPKRQSWPPVAA